MEKVTSGEVKGGESDGIRGGQSEERERGAVCVHV